MMRKKPQQFKTWIVYLIQSDCGFAYIGQTHNLKQRLTQHRKGASKTTSKVANPKSYKVLRLWPCAGMLQALTLEYKLQRFLRNFGTEATLRYQITVADLSEAKTNRFRNMVVGAYKRGVSEEEFYRTTFPTHSLGHNFDVELDHLCY